MMASSKKRLEQGPGEIEMLLPWHAAGTLDARETARVEEALARDPELARQYAAIREEYAETIDLNESLGAPSPRAMQKLFSAIDAEPVRRTSPAVHLTPRLRNFFASLSPRALGWSTRLGVLALLLQAGIIGAMLMNDKASYGIASVSTSDSATRALPRQSAAAVPARVLVRFAANARIAEITALLDRYDASIVDAKGGLFRLQFNRPMSKDEMANLLNRLQSEKIVSLPVVVQ